MRWDAKLSPKDGEQRVIKRFLWFPKLLRLPEPDFEEERPVHMQWRWWEWAVILQQYYGGRSGWRDKCWVPDLWPEARFSGK